MGGSDTNRGVPKIGDTIPVYGPGGEVIGEAEVIGPGPLGSEWVAWRGRGDAIADYLGAATRTAQAHFDESACAGPRPRRGK